MPRARDQWAAQPEVWLSAKNPGPLQADRVKIMLRLRGAAVGIDGLYAHMCGHTAAHRWLAAGGSETDSCLGLVDSTGTGSHEA